MRFLIGLRKRIDLSAQKEEKMLEIILNATCVVLNLIVIVLLIKDLKRKEERDPKEED